MDDAKYIAYAIPVFFLLIGVELWWTRDQRRYRLTDAINDLSCGVLQQIFTVFAKTALFAGYLWIYQQWRLMEVPINRWWAWVICFIGVDFCYYWFHRLSHEINALWAAHVVHHQSEDYNLAVALRQSVVQGVFSSFFYWPLALLGFPPLMFLALSAANTLYQFWIHTQAIKRLGLLEWVFNTPSHHRVHHGRNPIYIDRNHGGTLIIWDRLFGTFQGETEPVVYGITKPLASWSPLWANLHYWIELVQSARQTSGWWNKVRVFLKPPGWFPDDLGGFQPPPPVAPDYRKFDTPVGTRVKVYCLAHFALIVIATFAFLFAYPELRSLMRAGIAVWLSWSLINIGGLLQIQAWAHWSDFFRVLASLPLVSSLLLNQHKPLILVSWLLILLGAIWVLGLRQEQKNNELKAA